MGRRFDPRPHLVPGWSVAARPWWPAAVGGGASGGSAAGLGRELGAAVEVAWVAGVLGGCPAASFIDGQGGGGGSGVMAGGGKLAGGF